MNYSVELIEELQFIGEIINEQECKHRRLWRLAVATQPPIAYHQSAPCPEGTRIHQKPTASSEGAQLWDEQTPSHHLLVPQSGTDYPPQHHCGSVSPPSGNYIYVEVSHVPTAALLRSLQWVS